MILWGLLIGTQKVDIDSDGAICNMVHDLSEKESDIGVIKLGVKKMTRTSGIMMLATRKLCKRFGISVKQAVLEKGDMNVRTSSNPFQYA